MNNVNKLQKKHILLACLVTGVSLCSAMQMISYIRKKLTFAPKKGNPLFVPLSYEDVSFDTLDKCHITGWYLPSPSASSRLLIYFHGNGGNLGDYAESISKLNQRLKWNILAIDYRGYGQSSGEVSEEGILKDAEATLQFAQKSLSFSLQDIVLYGFSMGSAPASYLASRNPEIGGLIIQNGFTSILDLTDSCLATTMTSLFIPKVYLSKVSCPVLILHCKEDELCPFVHGQSLFLEVYKNPNHKKKKIFTSFEGNHNTSIFDEKKLYQAIHLLIPFSNKN